MANLIEISAQDNWITEEARQLIEYLVASGMIPDMDIQDDRVREVIRRKMNCYIIIQKCFSDSTAILHGS